MEIWLLLLVMACITFSNRYFFLVRSLRIQPSERFTRFLSYSAYAVLTAIWVPIIFSLDLSSNADSIVTLAGWDYLLGSLVAAVMAFNRFASIYVVLTSISVFAVCRYLLYALT